MEAGVYIDDAGTPGAESRSDFLYEDRKSWAAVIVPDNAVLDLEIALKIFLAGIRSDYGADELHFTDIYSGRREFKDVSTDERFKLFELMTQIFQKFKLPILYQTSSPEFLEEARRNFNIRETFGSLNLNRHEHFSLAILLFLVQDFLKANSNHFPLPLPVIVDEGIMKSGAKIKLGIWKEYFLNGCIAFAKSKSSPFLQLADFAAFVISRTQWLVARGNFNERDIEFMRIVSADKFQLINLPLVAVDPEKHTTEDYDEMLKYDRIKKGLPKNPPKKANKGMEGNG